MGKRNRYKAKTAAAVSAVAADFAGLGGSIFDGANFSTRRGYIYVPTVETRREVDTYSRLELIKRARWLKRNTGFAKRCINGVANMVGWLDPRPLTSDRDWNAAALKLWKARALSAEVFDLSGRFNANSYQPLLTRSRFSDGDILSVFTEQHGGAAVMTYESHQVSNGKRIVAEDGWRDGVKADGNNRHLAYSVVSNFETKESVDIPASHCVLHADFDSFGWRRGVTALHHGVNNLLDTTEIVSDLKLGIKTANRIGYYEFSPAGTIGSTRGLGDAVKDNLEKAKAPKGGDILLEDAFRGGKVPKLDGGRELRQLLDERPHPNSVAFLEHLCRDISWGFGIASDVLWNIAKLGGASVRYVLADAQTFIESQQQLLVDQFLTRFWIYFCAKEMAAGRLAKCADPNWFLVGWLPPEKLTVDIGRDGKLSIDLHRAGMLTMRRWYGMQGLDAEEEDRERVEEYARRIALCAEVEERYRKQGVDIRIDPERVFPTGIPGAAPVPGADPNDASREPAFSAPEQFANITNRLDEIAARLAA